LTKSGNQTTAPCGCCLCPNDQLDQLARFFRFRTVAEMRQIYEDAKRQKTKAARERICDAVSLKFQEVRPEARFRRTV